MARLDSLQFRRDTAANWTSVNPTLDAGEPGFETDTGLLKIGDGSTVWASLAYVTGAYALNSAHFVTTQAESGLSAEFNLGSLTTGLLKHSVSSSVSTPATATPDTDYTANAFKTISVSGQSDVVADSAADTLTFANGDNVAITTNAGTDTITVAVKLHSGKATLSSGTVTVSEGWVATGSIIVVTPTTGPSTAGTTLHVTNLVASTSFDIVSDDGSDGRDVFWIAIP